MISVVFNNQYNLPPREDRLGFTMVEVVVAIALIGIGVSTTIGALTKFNEFASTSRNATGAYTLAMNQIDAVQAATPVDPTKLYNATRVPQALENETWQISRTPPLVGTVTLESPSTVSGTIPNVPIYKEDGPTNAVVLGTVTTTVTDVGPTPGAAPFLYSVTVTVSYTSLNRNYTFSMSTLRTSD